MSYLRALLITDPLVILTTAVMGAINLVVSLFDSSGDVQMRVARLWARMLLVICRVKVRVEGLERISPQGSYVLAANHLSFMDTPVILASIPLPFRFMAKAGLFKIPLLGQHLARAGHVPVSSDNPRAAIKTLSHVAKMIQERRTSVLIFPEGGRSEHGELKEFKEGAAYIAIKAGVPLVPVAIRGTREVLPFGSHHMMSGKVELLVGDPIRTAGLSLHDRLRITEEAREQLVTLLEGQPVSTHA